MCLVGVFLSGFLSLQINHSTYICYFLYAGTKNLAEILSDRETIAQTMQAGLDEATDPWGVKVERVEM